jgi:transposase
MILMCILKETGKKIIREFSTLTRDIEAIWELMLSYGVDGVDMESTGVYWIPVWRILQGHFSLKLINPYFIRQLPRRKTDAKDSE